VSSPLDLDHVGAEIGKRLRAPGTREHAGQVQHADMAQGTHLRSVSSVALVLQWLAAARNGLSGILKRIAGAGGPARSAEWASRFAGRRPRARIYPV